MSIQSSNLILRTADLISSWTGIATASNPYRYTPNANGTIGYTTPFSYSGAFPNFVLSNNNTNWTWTNINFRYLLGDMYDKYERFGLVLECVSQGQTYGTDGTNTQLANTSEDLRVMINVGGLPFLNNTYDSVNKTTCSICQLEQLTITKNSTALTFFSLPLQATFSKVETADINIFLTRANDNQPLYTGATSQYPHLTFNFQIYGISNTNNDVKIIKPERIDNNSGRIR